MSTQIDMFDSPDTMNANDAVADEAPKKKKARKMKPSVKTTESTRKFWALRNKKTRRLLRDFTHQGVTVKAVFDKRHEARHWRDYLNSATKKTFVLTELG